MKAVHFAVLSIVFLAACDLKPPVTTRAFTSGTGPVAEGIVYYLPRSLVRVRFSSSGLEILGEERVMDPRAKLVLETRPRAASRDDFDFTVAQGLLETATVDSEDQIPAIYFETGARKNVLPAALLQQPARRRGSATGARQGR